MGSSRDLGSIFWELVLQVYGKRHKGTKARRHEEREQRKAQRDRGTKAQSEKQEEMKKPDLHPAFTNKLKLFFG